MTTERELSDEEVDWLETAVPVARSHSIAGNENLAACEDCDWVAQGEGIDYLMEQVTEHLHQFVVVLTEEQRSARRDAFIDRFGWDPWAEGTVREEGPVQGSDVIQVTSYDEDGSPVEEILIKVEEVEVDGGEGDDDLGWFFDRFKR